MLILPIIFPINIEIGMSSPERSVKFSHSWLLFLKLLTNFHFRMASHSKMEFEGNENVQPEGEHDLDKMDE